MAWWDLSFFPKIPYRQISVNGSLPFAVLRAVMHLMSVCRLVSGFSQGFELRGAAMTEHLVKEGRDAASPSGRRVGKASMHNWSVSDSYDPIWAEGNNPVKKCSRAYPRKAACIRTGAAGGRGGRGVG
jgi:hypothetical protein